MKPILLKRVLLALAVSLCISAVTAQSMCEKIITPKIEAIEVDIQSLQRDQAMGVSGDEFTNSLGKIEKAINHIESRINSCEIRGRTSLTALKERLNNSKKEHSLLSGKTPMSVQAEHDLTLTNQIIMKMQSSVSKYGNYCMEEEYKNLTRIEIEFVENYNDNASSYYKTNILSAQLYLKNLEKNVNNSDWVKHAKTTNDGKATSINEDLKSKYMNCFYNDLKYIHDVALPTNENVKEVLNYLRQFM